MLSPNFSRISGEFLAQPEGFIQKADGFTKISAIQHKAGGKRASLPSPKCNDIRLNIELNQRCHAKLAPKSKEEPNIFYKIPFGQPLAPEIST